MFFPGAPTSPSDAAADEDSQAPFEQGSIEQALVEDTWNWLIDTIAEEMARIPAPDRRRLPAALVARSGYEIADAGDASARVHNMRIRLTDALVAHSGENIQIETA